LQNSLTEVIVDSNKGHSTKHSQHLWRYI